MMFSLTTIGFLLSTPALAMLAVSFIVSLFEQRDCCVSQDCSGNLNA